MTSKAQPRNPRNSLTMYEKLQLIFELLGQVQNEIVKTSASDRAECGTVPFLTNRERFSLRCLRDFARLHLASAEAEHQNRCDPGLSWLDNLLDGEGRAGRNPDARVVKDDFYLSKFVDSSKLGKLPEVSDNDTPKENSPHAFKSYDVSSKPFLSDYCRHCTKPRSEHSAPQPALEANVPLEIVVKRFVVFSGDRFYPRGGWNDRQGSYDTLDAAVEAPIVGDWSHVVDLVTGQVFRIPIHDAAAAEHVRCDACACGSPRKDGGIHIDSARLGMSEDTPCGRVFVVRNGHAWLAYVDGAPLREENGGERRFAAAVAAYAVACEAAPPCNERCPHDRIIGERGDPNRPWFGRVGTCTCCRQRYGCLGRDPEEENRCTSCRADVSPPPRT